jgi:L-threonylcarbamoyladenylate synthase
VSLETPIIKLNTRKAEPDKLTTIARILAAESVIVYPTDTFYGLGASCFSRPAIRRIYSLKRRERTKPLSVVIADLTDVERMAEFIPPIFREIAKEFWPGPLTIVLRVREQFPREILGPGHSLGIRLPRLDWLRDLVREAGFPLIATSANISGEKEISSAEEAVAIFRGKADLIVDGGRTPGILPSTVIDLTSPHPRIIREGAIPKKKLQKYLA